MEPSVGRLGASRQQLTATSTSSSPTASPATLLTSRNITIEKTVNRIQSNWGDKACFFEQEDVPKKPLHKFVKKKAGPLSDAYKPMTAEQNENLVTTLFNNWKRAREAANPAEAASAALQGAAKTLKESQKEGKQEKMKKTRESATVTNLAKKRKTAVVVS